MTFPGSGTLTGPAVNSSSNRLQLDREFQRLHLSVLRFSRRLSEDRTCPFVGDTRTFGNSYPSEYLEQQLVLPHFGHNHRNATREKKQRECPGSEKNI